MSNDSEEFIFATLYRKRWLMLFLFCCTSLCNAYHWINLSIISDRVLVVWNATIPGSTEVARRMAVDWISLVYFVTYIPLIFPAFLVLNRFGLRVTNVTAAVLNTLGSWLKCVACVLATHTLNSPSAPGLVSSAYPLLMTAQTIEAVAQLFVLGIPSPLASTWFGERELSTATSIGVLANQLGTALGFAIPPLIVGTWYTAENDTIGARYEQMHREIEYLLYGSAAFTTLLAIPVILLFKERPPTAPSLAESLRLTKRNRRKSIGSGGTTLVSTSYNGEICTDGSWSIQQQLKSICTNRSFLLLTLCYGTNTGVAYAWSILLNVILQQYFQSESEYACVATTFKSIGSDGVMSNKAI
ncbi:unnamed protein product [Dicrocoelium dendriticum]|nr:unnamed protein product [Dicrocoelium dendriticum]